MRKIRFINDNEKAFAREMFSEYLKELSESNGDESAIDENGTPVYKSFGNYWTDRNKYPFYLIDSEIIAGICLAREVESAKLEIAEIYLKPKFRKYKNARFYVSQVARLFEGEVELSASVRTMYPKLKVF